MRRAATVMAACLLLTSFTARSGSASALLAPGFFMEYRVEEFAGGRRSEERFRVEVTDDLGGGRRLLALTLGGGQDYRAVYRSDDDHPPGVFALERFERVEGRQDSDWVGVDPGSIELLSVLASMEQRIQRSSADGDSSVTLGGREWLARHHALADTTERVQRSASVTLTLRTETRGEAWIAPELPLGGWLRYAESRSASKESEISGRTFSAEPEQSREVWTLVALGGPDLNNK